MKIHEAKTNLANEKSAEKPYHNACKVAPGVRDLEVVPGHVGIIEPVANEGCSADEEERRAKDALQYA